MFRIIFIFHSGKECKIAEEVKFARIAHVYQFYVKIGGVVRKIKFVVICFAFCWIDVYEILKRKPKVKHKETLEKAVLLK